MFALKKKLMWVISTHLNVWSAVSWVWDNYAGKGLTNCGKLILLFSLSSLLTPVKRGQSVWPYVITSDERLIEQDFSNVTFDEVSEWQHVRIVCSKQWGNTLYLDNDASKFTLIYPSMIKWFIKYFKYCSFFTKTLNYVRLSVWHFRWDFLIFLMK